MKKVMHARKPWIVNGKVAGENVGDPWCGAPSRRTDERKCVTCKRCLRLMNPKPSSASAQS